MSTKRKRVRPLTKRQRALLTELHMLVPADDVPTADLIRLARQLTNRHDLELGYFWGPLNTWLAERDEALI